MDNTILIGILKSNYKLALKHALINKAIENSKIQAENSPVSMKNYLLSLFNKSSLKNKY